MTIIVNISTCSRKVNSFGLKIKLGIVCSPQPQLVGGHGLHSTVEASYLQLRASVNLQILQVDKLRGGVNDGVDNVVAAVSLVTMAV